MWRGVQSTWGDFRDWDGVFAAAAAEALPSLITLSVRGSNQRRLNEPEC
jgi:hypothetical protein